MYIKHVSITGADNNVNPERLLELSLKYPMVEWAILFSENKQGTSRYPTREWRDEFYQKVPNVFRAAHICGKPYLQKFSNADEALKQELTNFQRAQLNFNSNHLDKLIYDGLVRNTVNQTFKYKDLYPVQIITQHNSANDLTHLDFKCDNHAVLFDASGGHGVAPDLVQPVLADFKCGYAGGISDQNIEHMLELIEKAAGETAIWIDMESGVRTNNELDLDKVVKVLDTVVKYQVKTVTMEP